MNSRKPDFPDSGRRANRWLLYVPLGIGLLVFIGYSVLWFAGAGIMRDEVNAWIADQRARGLTAEHGPIRVEGYPFLLRARLDDPVYGDREAGWEWQAERLYVDTLPYNPTRLIFTPNGEQKIRIESDEVREFWAITSDSIRASISETETAIDLFEVIAVPVDGASDTGFEKLEIGRFRANTLVTAEEESGSATGSFAMEGQNIALFATEPADNVMVEFVDAGVRASELEEFLDAAVGGRSYRPWHDAGGELTIDSVRLIINGAGETPPSQVGLTGTLFVDAGNYPAGKLQTSLANHEALLRLLIQYGVIAPENASTIDSALTTLSQAMGDELRVPIDLKNGKAQISTPLGGITIARLDRLD